MQSGETPNVKFVLVGDAATGKTSLLSRAVDEQFSEVYLSTLGVDFKSPLDETDLLKEIFWDTSSQASFRNFTLVYYAQADVFVVVFDVSSRATFESVSSTWLPQIKASSDTNKHHPILLVGNKADLPNREVSLAEAEDFAQTHHMMYLDFSCRSGHKAQVAEKLKELALKSLL